MSDRTSVNSFACTTSFLQTEDLVLVSQFKVVSLLEKKEKLTLKEIFYGFSLCKQNIAIIIISIIF